LNSADHRASSEKYHDPPPSRPPWAALDPGGAAAYTDEAVRTLKPGGGRGSNSIGIAPPSLLQGKDRIAMKLRRLAALVVFGLAVLLSASTVRAAEPDPKLVPADADMVAVGNYQQLIGTAMFKKHGLEPFKQTLQDPQLKPALQALGLDPLKDIDTVVVSNSG
jgi:hypothetical protein